MTENLLQINPENFSFVDSHCHMDSYAERTGTDFETWWNSVEPKPDAIVQVSCEEPTFAYTEALAEKFSQVYASFGVHPINADDYDERTEEKLKELWARPKTVGIGEIGFDYHYANASREAQRRIFERQLEIGLPFRKTFVLHLREAEEDSLSVLQNADLEGATLHVHSFSSSVPFLRELLKLPCRVFIGFTGILTFKNAPNVRDAAAIVPLDHLLFETDSPYLAPVPYRGTASHAGMIPKTAETLAKIKGVPLKELMDIVRENTRRCYGI